MPETMWSLQRAQIGKQPTPHTPAAATLRLVGAAVTDEPNPSMHEYGPMGQLFDTIAVPGIQSSIFKTAGRPDFNELAWFIASCLGNIAPTTPAGSVNARSRVWTPPVDDVSTPMPMTLEVGSNVRGRQYPDVVTKTLEFVFGSDKFEQNFDSFGGIVVENTALTAALAGVAEAPIVGEKTNVYLDTSSAAGLGTTQLLRYLEGKWSLADFYAPQFPGNRSILGYNFVAQMKPKATGLLVLEADSVGGGTIISLQQNNNYGWLRIDALGPPCDNSYLCTLGAPSAGTFTLTYNGVTTGGIAFNAIGSVVATALTGLTTVGAGNATVSGAAGGPYTISLLNNLLGSSNLLTGSGAGLTGGSFTLVQTLTNYELKIDTAVKFIKQSAYKNVLETAGNDWPFKIVKDPAWVTINPTGQALQITLINSQVAF